MIKIPSNKYINKGLPEIHKSELSELVEKRINHEIQNYVKEEYNKILTDMLDSSKDIYFENILIYKPYELMGIYLDFYNNYNFDEDYVEEDKKSKKKKIVRKKVFEDDGIDKRSELLNILSKIYDYDNFTNKKVREWDAYKLCQQLDIKICPYCNRSFIYTVIKNKNDKITRPQLDHFFPKSRFPMFAISFYNLIPCCSICNSTIKGDHFLDLESYHHPYLENDKILFKYRYIINSGTVPFTCDNVSVEIEPTKDIKTKNTYEYFKLDEIYKHHNDVAVDIINKYIIYNNVQIDEITKKVNKIQGNHIKEEDIRKIIFEECEEDEIIDKILGKIKKDLINQAASNK